MQRLRALRVGADAQQDSVSVRPPAAVQARSTRAPWPLGSSTAPASRQAQIGLCGGSRRLYSTGLAPGTKQVRLLGACMQCRMSSVGWRHGVRTAAPLSSGRLTPGELVRLVPMLQPELTWVARAGTNADNPCCRCLLAHLHTAWMRCRTSYCNRRRLRTAWMCQPRA